MACHAYVVILLPGSSNVCVISVTMCFSASLGVLLFSILLITKTAFQPLDLQNSFFILAAAFFIIFGYYTAVLVMRSGEISFISPFRYTAVLLALMVGFVFFDEQPDGIAFLGMKIVIISGIALMIRNNSVQKSILK